MRRAYWYGGARNGAGLDDPASIGRTAAMRTLRRLGARSVATQEVAVVFEPETAASLVGHVGSAVSGSMVYRGMSFLRDRLGARIAARGVPNVAAPPRPGGLASR